MKLCIWKYICKRQRQESNMQGDYVYSPFLEYYIRRIFFSFTRHIFYFDCKLFKIIFFNFIMIYVLNMFWLMLYTFFVTIDLYKMGTAEII